MRALESVGDKAMVHGDGGIANGKAKEFKNLYRNVDLLLV